MSRTYDMQAPIASQKWRIFSPLVVSREGRPMRGRAALIQAKPPRTRDRQRCVVTGPTRNQSLGPCREHSLVLTWGQSLSPLLTSFLIPNPSLPLPYPSWRLFGGGFVGFIRFFGVGGRNRWGQKAPGAENAYTTHPTIKIGLKAQF